MKWQLMEDAITFSDRLKLAKFVLTTNRFTNGERVRELEYEWNKWLGSENSLFVSSGSTANFLLIAALKEYLKLKDGDKVLVPACTWMTNVAPIIQLGLTPIFCDINTVDFSFNYANLDYISKKHQDIKLIFVTHLLGFTSIARNSGIFYDLFPHANIIDDVCESHGCKDNRGNKIGSNSLGATFSTYFGHHLTSIEGGFVSTNDKKLYDLMKMKRSHGMARESLNFDYYSKKYPNIDKSFLFITDGYNFRNTEIGAVLGLSQLKKLDRSIEIRNKNFKRFCSIMDKHDKLFYPVNYCDISSNFCLPFVARSKNTRLILQEKFQDNNIEYRPIVSGNLLKHPFLKGYSICTDKKTTNADLIHNNGIYIGNSQFISNKHLDKLENIMESL